MLENIQKAITFYANEKQKLKLKFQNQIGSYGEKNIENLVKAFEASTHSDIFGTEY